jgi:translation initiation factor 3 subunit K
MPSTDFMLCMYLLPPSLEADPTITGLKLLADYLESCFFEKFWNELPKVKVEVPGFEAAIRDFIAGVVSSTFNLIDPAELSVYMKVSSGDLDAAIKKYGWEKTAEGVRIPRNEQNQATGVVRVKQEGINFENIAPVVVASGLR